MKGQFNVTNATGSSWASHHNLNIYTLRYTGVSSGWPLGAWTGYTTKKGEVISSVREQAGLHCSDCHLNEVNAHGSANAWYMLANEDIATDPNGTAVVTPTAATAGDQAATDKNLCFRCHAAATYAIITGSGTNSRTDAHNNECNRIDAAGEYAFANQCTGCHGSWSESTPGGLGSIHGNNDTYTPTAAGTATKRYRFMSGGGNRFYDPTDGAFTADTDWEANTDVGCYTIGTADSFSTCTGHTGGKTVSASGRTRALDY